MKKKIFSGILSLVMLLSLLPVSAFATGNETSSSNASIEEYQGDGYTSGLISTSVRTQEGDSGKTAQVLTASIKNGASVNFVKANAQVGRSSDGYWIGVKILAPAGTTLGTESSGNITGAKFRSSNNTADRAWNTPSVDGGTGSGQTPFMFAWAGYQDDWFASGYTGSQPRWYFNWDGKDDTGITIPASEFVVANNETATEMKGVDTIVEVNFILTDENVKLIKDSTTVWDSSKMPVAEMAVEGGRTAQFRSLAEAVAATKTLKAPANGSHVIKLLRDVTDGSGIKFNPSNNASNITIDFNNHTYTAANTTVGSTGTETQGMQILKGSTVTLKNGTFGVGTGGAFGTTFVPCELVKNYGNLTLENITLDGSNLLQGNINGVVFPKTSSFTLNSYNGTVQLTNTTIKNSSKGVPYSIGCGWWPGNNGQGAYNAGTQITVDDKSTFENVLLYRDDAQQNGGANGANSTIKLGNTTYALKYETTDSPYYVEFAKSGNALTPVLPEATVNYTALADKTIVSDCVDKTMWVQFDKALPGNTWLWFDIKGSGADAPTYGIAAQAKNDGKTTKFAWSFLNKDQFEAWPKNGNTEIATGIESGDYTVTCYLLTGKADSVTAKPADAIKLWDKTVTVADLAPVVTEPIVTLPEDADIPSGKEGEVKAAAANVALPAADMNKLSNAAYETVVANPPAETAVNAALNEANITVGTDETVNLVVQTYMDVAVTKYTPASDTTPATLTYDITPMYRVVATTETDTSKIAVSGEISQGETANAAVVTEGQELTVSQPVEVTIGLPTGFVAAKEDGSYPSVYVQHKGHEYEATVTGRTSGSGSSSTTTLTAVFTNPHGFSTFTITANSTAVAKTDDDESYTTLQAAVDSVADNGVITVLKSDLNATVNKAVVFTVKTEGTGVTQPTITAGSGYKLSQETVSDGIKYTVTRDGGSGGGGSSASVSVPSATNGKVTVSNSNAKKGDTVTVTVTPNTGYAVDTVTVTDSKGNAVEVTKTDDTHYTFVMPDGRVTVRATFKQSEVTPPPATGFTDVAADAYYADAVKWAVDKGITNGLTATTFGPNNSCTRGQMVTFLWRAAGSPAAIGTNSFSDVASGEYYYNAVLWAVEKGITNGTSATTFSPNATVNRGQTVTFLYRYAESPAATGDTSFTDVAADAFYADAVKWAVAEEITNGTSSTTFSPASNCTRGQIVTFMYRQMAE